MSDEEAMVRKPKVAKPAAADDDDAPMARKPKTAKAAAVAADDDEDNKVKKVVKAHVKKGAEPDDDDTAAVVRKPKANAQQHVDPAAADGEQFPTKAGQPASQGGSSSAIVDRIDYDSMTEEDFLAHLCKQSKQQRLAEMEAIVEARAAAATTDDSAKHFDGSPAYTYKFMLDRILEICRKVNPESERIKLPMPKIEKMGSKRTVLTNFADFCKALNRTQEDVKDFIEKELTTQGSIDANGCLILRFQNAKVQTFEKLMIKYVEEFVKCSACGRIQTELEKESSSRLLVMKCRDCKASRYVQVAGSATFKAQTGKRRDRPVMA